VLALRENARYAQLKAATDAADAAAYEAQRERARAVTDMDRDEGEGEGEVGVDADSASRLAAMKAKRQAAQEEAAQAAALAQRAAAEGAVAEAEASLAAASSRRARRAAALALGAAKMVLGRVLAAQDEQATRQAAARARLDATLRERAARARAEVGRLGRAARLAALQRSSLAAQLQRVAQDGEFLRSVPLLATLPPATLRRLGGALRRVSLMMRRARHLLATAPQ
jgi:hypothetical protein